MENTTDGVLSQRVADRLRREHQLLYDSGALMTSDQLRDAYDRFRSRFGPERLLSIDGEPLLDLIHDHSNRDSLVYWLEFKDDDEMPAVFGSIAGGSSIGWDRFLAGDFAE